VVLADVALECHVWHGVQIQHPIAGAGRGIQEGEAGQGEDDLDAMHRNRK